MYAYTFISNVGMGSNSGGSWIPFLDGIFKLVWQVAAPEFIRGFVTAGAALWLSLRLLKNANRQTVAMAAVAVFITITVVIGAMYLVETGPSFYFLFTIASFAIGLAVGGWAAAEAA